jgi:hypothetical protein
MIEGLTAFLLSGNLFCTTSTLWVVAGMGPDLPACTHPSIERWKSKADPMVRNSLVVEFLTNAGCSVRQAEAFERWLDDARPVGISSLVLERAVTKTLGKDAAVYATALQSLERQNRVLEEEVEAFRFNRTARLF